MKVRIKFFAAPREALGTGEVEQELPSGSRVQELMALLWKEYPALRPYACLTRIAVNRKYVAWESELHDGDEVACVPPVGGG